jgi:hypothetical protein
MEADYSMRHIPAQYDRKRFIPTNTDMEFMTSMATIKALYYSERMKGIHKIKDNINEHKDVITFDDQLDIANEYRLNQLGVRPFDSLTHFRSPSQFDQMGLSGKYIPKPNPSELFHLPTYINPADKSHKEELYKKFIKPAKERPEKMTLDEAKSIKIDRHRPLLPSILY